MVKSGEWRDAWFWTKALAAIWLVALLVVEGPGAFLATPGSVADVPVAEELALLPKPSLPAAAQDACAAAVSLPDDGDRRVVPDLALDGDGNLDPEQYTDFATGKPLAVIEIAAGAANFAPGVYYRLPDEVAFIPHLRSVVAADSIPYVNAALHAVLQRLTCIVGSDQGKVRVNRALMPIPQQRHYETELHVPAHGLGTEALHLQIVDARTEMPWDNERIAAAVAKVELVTPSLAYRAYVRLEAKQQAAR